MLNIGITLKMGRLNHKKSKLVQNYQPTDVIL